MDELIVLGQQYCFGEDTDLILELDRDKKKKRSKRELQFSNASGNLLLSVGKTESLSWRHNKTRLLKDANGNPLLKIYEKGSFFGSETWVAKPGDCRKKEQDPEIFRVQPSSFFQFKTKMDVFLGREQQPSVKIKCSWNEHSAQIFNGSRLIAEVRKENGWHKKHVIRVCSHVDYVLVATLVVIVFYLRVELRSRRSQSSAAAAAAGGASTGGASTGGAAAACG